MLFLLPKYKISNNNWRREEKKKIARAPFTNTTRWTRLDVIHSRSFNQASRKCEKDRRKKIATNAKRASSEKTTQCYDWAQIKRCDSGNKQSVVISDRVREVSSSTRFKWKRFCDFQTVSFFCCNSLLIITFVIFFRIFFF